MSSPIEKIYNWLEELNKRCSPFDSKTWVPLTKRHPELSIKELWKLLENQRGRDEVPVNK